MTPHELLGEGVEIMLYGIGFVYAFLVLLIVCIQCMSRLIERFAPAPVVTAPVARAKPKANAETDPVIIAAIQAAINQHRAKRG